MFRLLIDEWRSRRLRSVTDREEALYRQALASARTEEQERRITIAFIRCNLHALGIDTSKYTDDEIEQSVVRFGECVASTGVTAEEFSASLTRFMQVVNSANPPLPA